MRFRLLPDKPVRLAAPLLYLYALQQCPSRQSFDAKKELKRVSRGEHLPETHPDKPKGVLEAMAARVAASVATELVTLPGYEVSMTNLAGAAIVATVTVPAKTEFYWVGAFDKWYYVTSSIDGMQVVYESKAKGIGERTSPKQQNDE